jgi:hypothetical protein
LKNKTYGRRLKIYATSTAGSMVVEGAEASAAGCWNDSSKNSAQKSRMLSIEK